MSNNVYDYVFVSQGKVTIPNVDDGEECTLTDVSLQSSCLKMSPFLQTQCVHLRVLCIQIGQRKLSNSSSNLNWRFLYAQIKIYYQNYPQQKN